MSGKRVSLATLAEDIPMPKADAAAAAPTDVPAEVAVERLPPRASSGGVAPSKLKSVPASRSRTFDRFDRKEARLRTEQYQELTTLSRGLNRIRNRAGERITENTLIRVAIDMLLAKQSDLAGATEDEIRRSVGL